MKLNNMDVSIKCFRNNSCQRCFIISDLYSFLIDNLVIVTTKTTVERHVTVGDKEILIRLVFVKLGNLYCRFVKFGSPSFSNRQTDMAQSSRSVILILRKELYTLRGLPRNLLSITNISTKFFWQFSI